MAVLYRQRVVAVREAAKARIAARLAAVDLTRSQVAVSADLWGWLDDAVPYVAAAQQVAVHSSELYLLAAVALAGGDRRTFADLQVDPAAFVGVSYGRPLDAVLRTAAVSVLWRLNQGADVQVASTTGIAFAARAARTAVMSSARESLTAGMDAHPVVTGWVRVTSGSACIFCASDTGIHAPDEPLEGHPSCGCVEEVVTESDPALSSEPVE